jgi:hypothetical protein
MSTWAKVKSPKAKTQKATQSHSKAPLTELTQRQRRKERGAVSVDVGVMEGDSRRGIQGEGNYYRVPRRRGWDEPILLNASDVF